MSTMSGNNKAV